MPISKFVGESVYILRGDGSRLELAECVITPVGSSTSFREDDGSIWLTDRLAVLTPAEVDRKIVVLGAQIEVRGLVYKVEAAPFDYVSFYGTGRSGTMIPLKYHSAGDPVDPGPGPVDPEEPEQPAAPFVKQADGRVMEVATGKYVKDSMGDWKPSAPGPWYKNEKGELVDGAGKTAFDDDGYPIKAPK